MFKLNQYKYTAKTYIMLLLGISLLTGCSQSLMEYAKGDYEFIAVGYAAVSAQKGESEDIKTLNAIKASKIDAYKELAEQVYGVMLTSEDSVNNHQLQSEILEVKVVGLIRGAKVLRTYHEGDLYITELELKLETLPDVGYETALPIENGIHVEPQIYY